jgi:hypothetical protein
MGVAIFYIFVFFSLIKIPNVFGNEFLLVDGPLLVGAMVNLVKARLHDHV